MSAGAEHTGEVYVYGVTSVDAEIPDLTGVGDRPVRATSLGDVAAVVSDLPDLDDFGTPADIRAHTTVLDGLASRISVLPMAFGTIVPNIGGLREISDPDRQQQYLAALERVEGATQFSVRARYVEETVIRELVQENPAVARLREATRGQAPDATHYERIRLGELIVQGMQDKGAQDAARIVESLQSLARELRMRETTAAEDVLDVAALVDRDDQEAFEAALEDMAASMPARITFRLVGPQAPYDFVGEA